MLAEESFERDWRRQLSRPDQRSGDLEDAAMNLLDEMVAPEEVGHAVERVVVDEDRAEQRLLRLEVVRRRAIGTVLGLRRALRQLFDRRHGDQRVSGRVEGKRTRTTRIRRITRPTAPPANPASLSKGGAGSSEASRYPVSSNRSTGSLRTRIAFVPAIQRRRRTQETPLDFDALAAPGEGGAEIPLNRKYSEKYLLLQKHRLS